MSGGFASGGGGFTDQLSADLLQARFAGAGPHLIGASGLVFRSDLPAASTDSDVTINTNVTRTDGLLLDIKNLNTRKVAVTNNGTIVGYSGGYSGAVLSGSIESTSATRLALLASSGGATLALGVEMKEQTAPAGVANAAILFAKDNGAGKTQLMVIYGTGAAKQLDIEL